MSGPVPHMRGKSFCSQRGENCPHLHSAYIFAEKSDVQLTDYSVTELDTRVCNLEGLSSYNTSGYL